MLYVWLLYVFSRYKKSPDKNDCYRKYLLFWTRTVKTLIVIYQRWMRTTSYCWLIQVFSFDCDNKIISKINKKTEPIMTVFRFNHRRKDSIICCIVVFSSMCSRNNWSSLCFFFFKKNSRIPVDILSDFKKSLEQFNKRKSNRETSWKFQLVKVYLEKNLHLILHFWSSDYLEKMSISLPLIFRGKTIRYLEHLPLAFESLRYWECTAKPFLRFFTKKEQKKH